MRSSEHTNEIGAALAAAQAELMNPYAAQEVDAGRYTYKFCPLPVLIDHVRPVLAKHKLAVIQDTVSEGNLFGCSTRIIHESGQWIETGPLLMPNSKGDAQGAGSAVSYARRYAVAAILGLAPDHDDDGAAASEKPRMDHMALIRAIKGAPDTESLKGVWGRWYTKWEGFAGMPQSEYQLIERAKDERKAELEKPPEDTLADISAAVVKSMEADEVGREPLESTVTDIEESLKGCMDEPERCKIVTGYMASSNFWNAMTDRQRERLTGARARAKVRIHAEESQ